MPGSLSKSWSEKLSLLVVLGSAFSRLPQIAKLILSGSSDGLTFAMYLTEVAACSVSSFYHSAKHFPLITYGENIAFILQDLIIIFLMTKFKMPQRLAEFWRGLLAYGLISGSVGILGRARNSAYIRCLEILQSFSVPALLVSRIWQIITNRNRGHAGELSAVPFVLNLLGSIIRLFTTLKELKGDPIMIMAFFSSIVVNSSLVLQISMSNKKSKATSRT